MELFEVIKARRSYRGLYQQESVSREDLRLIRKAALAAPSGCNKQTVSVISVDDPALVKQLGDMLNKPNFASAPAAVCILSEKKIACQGRAFAVQDYSAAIENALLAVQGLGLETCWVEGYVTDTGNIGAKWQTCWACRKTSIWCATCPSAMLPKRAAAFGKCPLKSGHGSTATANNFLYKPLPGQGNIRILKKRKECIFFFPFPLVLKKRAC